MSRGASDPLFFTLLQRSRDVAAADATTDETPDIGVIELQRSRDVGSADAMRRARGMTHSSWLQRSRDVAAADAPVPFNVSDQYYSLQRSRDVAAAETWPTPRERTRCSSRFNGAATLPPRKRPRLRNRRG